MNIKSRPLLIAAGIALAVQIALAVISTASSMLIPGLMLNNVDPTTAPSPSIMSGVMALSSVLCCVSAIIDVGAGAFYAYLHNKQEPIVLQDGLVGGAVTGALARVISSVISVLINVLMTPILMRQLTSQMGDAAMPPDALGAMMGVSIVGGLLGGGINVCITLITGSMLGALGGGVVASLSERRQNA